MTSKQKPVNPEDDLGFGYQAVRQRIINRDGTINVKRRGVSFLNNSNVYHRMITMSWLNFWLVIFIWYTLVNILFAFIYIAIGSQYLLGTDGNDGLHHFLGAFFFSAQTLSTVGYGHISPTGIATNFVAAIESMCGLLGFAVATGLLYGRFSRPSAKIAYSDKILIAPYALNKGRGLMFRMANLRPNLLAEMSVEVIFSYNEIVNGKPVRRFYPLDLERSKVSIMTLSWTIVHPINEDSPMYNWTLDDFKTKNGGFAVLVKAFDDTFAQTVHSRTSYEYSEIVWGASFTPTFHTDENGQVNLDLDKISSYKLVEQF
ncbi:ion channel [Mucilaginibacter sp. KACC 22063]|uniref:ion channel n=1 Tax=Mucilaginibacter sp. KACC 22063 TaxID=3025666 RepID=UPI002365B298|nr:ion channel [Mucilaginibacter sp. KACC 22063]WDF53368.1 ion channel [Mucilaginibacter sp. KACC 22063]